MADFYTHQTRIILPLTITLAAGIVAAWLCMWMLIGYDPLVRWHAAFGFHVVWKHAPAQIGFAEGIRNIAEFVDWMGVAITLLALAIVPVFIIEKYERPALMRALGLLFGLAGIIIYLAFFARTVAEIARLWIFLMPVVCIVAAIALSHLRATSRAPVLVIFMLQFLAVYFIKISHDFW